MARDWLALIQFGVYFPGRNGIANDSCQESDVVKLHDVGLLDSMHLQGSIDEMVEIAPSIFDDEDREDQQPEP